MMKVVGFFFCSNKKKNKRRKEKLTYTCIDSDRFQSNIITPPPPPMLSYIDGKENITLAIKKKTKQN